MAELLDRLWFLGPPRRIMEGMSDASSNQALEARIRALLATIDDPEMPISIIDLGIVAGVEIDHRTACVFITPTFTGCPALQMIDDQIVQIVGALPDVDKVVVKHVFDPPWRANRITEAGRERLRKHGVTVPAPQFVQMRSPTKEAVACPFCESEQTRLDSPFGPTRCRMIYYCPSCRNTFEHLKTG